MDGKEWILAVVAGGRNEETSSKYAVGARIKQLPSRRQQQRRFGVVGVGCGCRVNAGNLAF